MSMHDGPDNWNAQHYKEHSEGQFITGISIVKSLRLFSEAHVFDVGCGDGKITAEIAHIVSHGYVLGIDCSPNMIAQAQKDYGAIKNLDFRVGDILNFSSNHLFDSVVSFATFHWISNQQDALRNIYDVLKPGGMLALYMGAVQDGPIGETFELPRWKQMLSARGQSYFPQTIASFDNMLKTIGFKDSTINRVVKKTKYDTQEALFNKIFAWVPASTNFPDELAREFTWDIVKNISKASPEGTLFYEAALLDVRAIK